MNDTRTESCGTCKHRNGEGGQVECRAHPPIMIVGGTQQTISGPRIALMPAIPVVAPDYWCGEWSPRYAAIYEIERA